MNKKSILVLLIFIGIICSLGAVSAHEGMPNPSVVVNNTLPNEEVSGDVDFEFEVKHVDGELKYIKVTAEHMETKTNYLDKNDSNPSDGWSISWDTSNSPNGEYWITAIPHDGNGLEGKYEMKVILNNIPVNSSIVLENPTFVVNKSSNIVASLKDNSSNPLSGKTLEFTIDGKTIYANTTKEGFATVSFTPREIKNYELTVKFAGDYRYCQSQISDLVKVMSNLNTSSVTVNDIRGNNKEKIMLKASLSCPGLYDANVGKRIDFYVNNNFIGSNLTNENGEAVFYYVVNETGGTYLYHARYQNESGDNFTDYASLYVPQSELYMSMDAITYSIDGIFTVGNVFKLNYAVHNNGPDNAENTVVKYVIPGSLKYVQSSASKGSVSVNSNTLVWTIGDVPVGNQHLEAMFEVLSAGRIALTPSVSTVTYDESAGNAAPTRVLTVNSYNLVGNNLVKYYGGSGKYVVYLYTSDGKPVSGATIKVTINKQTFSLKTNSLGFVELAVNLKAGKYTITSSCNKLSISNSITIKPILITKNISKKKAKKIKFTAKLLNSNGKAAKNKKIVFKIKGKKYVAKTNKKGIATVVLKNLKPGKYTIKTSYGKISVKNTIKIRK